MSRLNSFYLTPSRWKEPFFLDGEESRHLTRVLRAKAGDTVRLFDGQGRWGLFCIKELATKNTRLERLSEHTNLAPARPLTLAVGWSKGVRRGFLLEKAVELGAAQVWFWQGMRSQGAVPETGKEGWERQLAAAGKQCGAVWLPRIRTFSEPRDLLRASADFGSKVLCWEQAEDDFVKPPLLAHPWGSIVVLGPEGGLAAQEVGLFREHGFTSVSLGRNILRFETAAVLILSLHFWAAHEGCG